MRALACALAIAAATAPSTARAGDGVDPVFEARMHYEQGEDAYVKGHYYEALQQFEEAYRITTRPALLYNISLCFEKLGQPAAAAAALRRYLAEDPSVHDRDQLLKKAAELEALAGGAPNAAVPGVPAAGTTATGNSAARNFSRPRLHVRGFQRATLASAGVTVGLAAIAAALTIIAAVSYQGLAEHCSSGVDCDAGARNRQSALNHSADALWACAGAGAIATVTLHLLLRRERKRAAAIVPSVAISPSAIAGGLRFNF